MSTPRLRCLDAGLKGVPGLRAAFSTTRIVCADKHVSSSADLLAALGDSKPRPQAPRPSPQSTQSHRISPPINIPPRRSSPPNAPPTTSRYHERLQKLTKGVLERNQRGAQNSKLKDNGPSIAEKLQIKEASDSLSRQIRRKWKAGDVYAPHDLSWQEQKKFAEAPKQPKFDIFDALNFNPLDHYKNFSVLSEYMTPMGRIEKRSQTGLRPVNQRRIAKSIRRAIGMGMMPSVHRHPELLQRSADAAALQSRQVDMFSSPSF